MKKRNLITLLLASVLLVGCRGESVSTSDSTSQGGSDSSSISTTSETSLPTSEPTSETPSSESTSEIPSSDSTSTSGSDSTSDVPPEPTTYTLSYVDGENNPIDLVVDIVDTNYEPIVDLIEESWDFEPGVSLAVSPYTEQAGISIKEVLLNGTALTADSAGQYPFTMPEQDSTITINFAIPHTLNATYNIDGAAEIFFYEQDSFDASAPQVTSAIEGASIFAYLSFNDGYYYKEYSVTVKNGEEVLSPDASYQEQGLYVYHFVMPDANVSLSVELTAIEYTWDYYFGRDDYGVMEKIYDASMTIAEIKEYVPFIRLSLYEFSSVTWQIDSDSNTLYWVLAGKSFDNYSDAYDETTTITNILGQVLSSDWKYDSAYRMYYNALSDEFEIHVASVYYQDTSTGLYIAGIYFSAWHYVEPTNWKETFFNYVDYESAEAQSTYPYALTVNEIDANVPWWLIDFQYINSFMSQFNSSYNAWGWVNDSTYDTVEADVAAIDAMLAEHLTTELGWTKGSITDTLSGYYKEITDKTIWVYASDISYPATNTYYSCLVFDAAVKYTKWSQYFQYIEEHEAELTFAVSAENIDKHFPFFESYYVQTYLYVDSAASLYDAAWAVGVNTLTSEEAMATAVAQLKADLDAIYGAAGSDWSPSGLPFHGEFLEGYSINDPATGLTYFIYARGQVYEDYSGNKTYLAYYVFDCMHPSWTNYFLGDTPTEEHYQMAMTIREIKSLIPYWSSEYARFTYLMESQFTEGYYTWSVGSSHSTEAAQTAAVTAMNAELAANLTEAAGWSSRTDSDGTTYFYKSNGYSTYYVYVATSTTRNSNGTTSYSAYFVFDEELTWGSLQMTGLYSSYTAAFVASSLEQFSQFTIRLSALSSKVDFVSTINWAGMLFKESTLNPNKYVWYAVYETTAEAASTDKAAIVAAFRAALTDFTYNEAESRFEQVDETTGDTLVVIIETNADNTQIQVVFDVIAAATETPAE